MLSRAGIASLAPSYVQPAPERPSAEPPRKTEQPRRVAKTAFAGVALVAAGTAAIVALALANREPPPALAPTAEEPLSTTTLTAADVAATTQMTPPLALTAAPVAREEEPKRFVAPPAETVDIDGPTPPSPATTQPLPKPAETTAPAETSDPLR
jgi:hypothetical protein